ncbi:MAG: Bax inhibitor-1/YccA family protein [bacterium]
MSSNIYPFPAISQEKAVSAFLQKVYIWMTGGLILTGVIAFQVAQSETLFRMIVLNQGVFMGLILGELAVVMAMSFLANRVSATVAGALFILYSAMNGLTLSVVLLVYTAQSVAQVFFITAGMFGGMSLYGYATKRDLTSLGSFMTMGLWGIILTMIVNFFLKSPAISYAISLIGVVIFLGLTAYDTQKLKALALNAPEVTEGSEKPAIYGALTLYLDFINLFLMLLRVMGRRR